MKNQCIYTLFFLLSILAFSSCGDDNIEDLTDENSLASLYEESGRIDMTVNGQSIDEPLVGFILAHPSLNDGIHGNTFSFFTWTIESWIQFFVEQDIPDNKKLEILTLFIGTEYTGTGRYILDDKSQISYGFSFYDKENETTIDENSFDSTVTGNNNDNGFIEITSDDNGSVKGLFSSKVISEETGEQLQIEGTFDVKYEE